MIMAIATAASAAAIVIINMVKKMPSSLSGYRYLLNTTKFMFTLFNINSIDISIVIMLRRVNKPYMPIKNKAVLTNRKCDIGMSVIILQLFLCPLNSQYCLAFVLLFLLKKLQQELLWRSQYNQPLPLIIKCSLLQKAMHSHFHRLPAFGFRSCLHSSQNFCRQL